jgi:hypothetical protein
MINRLVSIIILNCLLLLVSCQESGYTIDRIIITGLNDLITIDKYVNISAKAIIGTDTSEISDVTWITSDDGCYRLLWETLVPYKPGKTKIECQYKTLIAEKTFEILESSESKIFYYVMLDDLGPPSDYYQIMEGSCGEAVLWTICQYFGKNLSQEAINKIGGDPGRGLHSNEVIYVLDSLKINHKIHEKAVTWESTVDTLASIIIRGNPVILGVKIYPDRFSYWFADHFILLTGVDTKFDLFYYNSFSTAETISFAKLCNTQDGFSLINKYNAIFAIEILLGP